MGCGYERPAKAMEDAAHGIMSEIFIGEGKNKKKLADNAEHLWHQVVRYAKEHSQPDKQQGRAYHLFKKIAGYDPIWKFTTAPAVEITRNVQNKILQLNMAYKKAVKR
jgi:hypothetical protein